MEQSSPNPGPNDDKSAFRKAFKALLATQKEQDIALNLLVEDHVALDGRMVNQMWPRFEQILGFAEHLSTMLVKNCEAVDLLSQEVIILRNEVKELKAERTKVPTEPAMEAIQSSLLDLAAKVETRDQTAATDSTLIIGGLEEPIADEDKTGEENA